MANVTRVEAGMIRDETPRVRWGLWMLPLGAVVLVGALLSRGPLADATLAPLAFAATAVETTFIIGWAAMVAAVTLILFGFLALYAHLMEDKVRDWALGAVIFTVLAVAVMLPLAGFYGLAAPAAGQLYLNGVTQALAPFTGIFLLATAVLAGIAYTVGSVLFGAAAYRSSDLPGWTGGLLVLQAPMVAFGVYVSFAVEVVGAILLLVAAVGIASEVGFEHRLATGLKMKRARPKAA